MIRRLLMTAIAPGTLCNTALGGVGDPAPDFELTNLMAAKDASDRSVKLSELKGRVVVLSFWATWCAPCKEEMPHLNKFYMEHKDDGLTILSVSIDDARNLSKVKPYIKSKGYSFPVVNDKDSSVISHYNTAKVVPYTVVIGRDGKVAAQHSGYNPGDEEKLLEELKTLLANK